MSAECFLRPSFAAASGERDGADVIAPPPLIYIAGLALGFGLDAFLPEAALPDWLAWSIGGALLLAGLALAVSFIGAFRRAGTPVSPGESVTQLVTTGPYRVSRNPGYLGMALAFAGVAVVSGALWVLVVLVPTLIVVDRGVIRREERYLERKFGEEYSRYRARTRRWL